MGLLHDILAQKKNEVDALSRLPRPVRPKGWATLDARAALARKAHAPLRLIGEIKFRSPSAGPLSRVLSTGDRAAAYTAGGAAMISVLTDSKWFDGSFDDLRTARARVTLPLLCKDFVIDPIQIDHAWAAGADAVLIIVRCISNDDALRRLLSATTERGLTPFVEVVDERELEWALACGAKLIGVNARDLDALDIDIERAARVLASIPKDCVAVHLSGVKSGAAVAEIASSRADAALIGEALMRCDNPSPLLAELTRAATGVASGPSTQN